MVALDSDFPQLIIEISACVEHIDFDHVLQLLELAEEVRMVEGAITDERVTGAPFAGDDLTADLPDHVTAFGHHS